MKKIPRQPTIQELEKELKSIQKVLQTARPVPPVSPVPSRALPTGLEPLYRRQKEIITELKKRRS